MLFQLQLKSVFRLCEPVQQKGGVLHCVWKRKGPKQQCSSYRGILVSSVLGKSLHKLLRRHQGLLFRQLRQAGALLPLDLLPAQPTKECCVVCGKQFRDLRAWAVHAFSIHGRVDESRTIVAGTQCPICLKHYSSNVKLSRHVPYSKTCRGQLLALGQRHHPEPGIRSRKGPDDSLHLGPPLQALGPMPAQREIQLDEERDRPSAEVLDCLAHVTYDQAAESLPTQTIWSRLCLAFSCVCLPVSRLRETAHCWRSRLLSDGTLTGCPPDGRLLEAADWICQADLADWLVSEPGADQKAGDTFRLADLHLSLLECRSVRFPAPTCLPDDVITVLIGRIPTAYADTAAPESTVMYDHATSLASIAEGHTPDFLEDLLPLSPGFACSLCTASCGRREEV